MKRLFLILLLMGLVAFQGRAQTTMTRFLANTPDSVFEFVSQEMLAKLSDYVQLTKSDGASNGVTLEVVNRFEEKTSLDSMAADYVSLSLSETLKVQMMALQRFDGDTIVCVVKTYRAPEPESVVSFYNLSWQPLNTIDYLRPFVPEQLYARPDSMSSERYEELIRYIDPIMIYVDVVPQQKMLVFALATPMLNEEDIMQLNAILLQRKVKWNGKIFEKC